MTNITFDEIAQTIKDLARNATNLEYEKLGDIRHITLTYGIEGVEYCSKIHIINIPGDVTTINIDAAGYFEHDFLKDTSKHFLLIAEDLESIRKYLSQGGMKIC